MSRFTVIRFVAALVAGLAIVSPLPAFGDSSRATETVTVLSYAPPITVTLYQSSNLATSTVTQTVCATECSLELVVGTTTAIASTTRNLEAPGGNLGLTSPTSSVVAAITPAASAAVTSRQIVAPGNNVGMTVVTTSGGVTIATLPTLAALQKKDDMSSSTHHQHKSARRRHRQSATASATFSLVESDDNSLMETQSVGHYHPKVDASTTLAPTEGNDNWPMETLFADHHHHHHHHRKAAAAALETFAPAEGQDGVNGATMQCVPELADIPCMLGDSQCSEDLGKVYMCGYGDGTGTPCYVLNADCGAQNLFCNPYSFDSSCVSQGQLDEQDSLSSDGPEPDSEWDMDDPAAATQTFAAEPTATYCDNDQSDQAPPTITLDVFPEEEGSSDAWLGEDEGDS